jgi:SAM-dependent methyltransferase
MSHQARAWSQSAEHYEQEFVDPFLPGVENPLLEEVLGISGPTLTAADLGCGTGPLLPFLARNFRRVIAVDFAEGMLVRARDRCKEIANVEFHRRSLTDLDPFRGQVDVAVAVNSLILPDLDALERALDGIHALLKPNGHFVGIVPAMDAVHYFTMLLVDRARRAGMPLAKARQNAAHHAEHHLYDFAFGGFQYLGLDQHFWQPFEVRHRLKRAAFRGVRLVKVRLAWEQFGCARDLMPEPPPWDWFFHARA